MIILEQVNLAELPERLLLLKLPAETRLTVTVEDSNTVQPRWDKSTVLAAMNPGASKWNPIEHRVFSQISRNWFGHPLRTLLIMLNFIRGTTTKEGLTIDAKLDSTIYEKGISISKQDMKLLNIHFRKFCPNLNYTIEPQKSGNN